jgi:hypothetical protein
MSRGARKFGKNLVHSTIGLIVDRDDADSIDTLIPPSPRSGFEGHYQRKAEVDLLFPRADAITQEAILTLLRRAVGC